MKKFKLKKIIAVVLAAATLSTLYPLNTDAAWVKDSNGWWNTEGNSWSVGWRLIENKWYYFDRQGYMKTGWILDGGKWYYLNADGSMAKDITVDGYELGADGAWIEIIEGSIAEINTNSGSDNNSEAGKHLTTNELIDFTMNEFTDLLKDKGYDPQVKDAEKGFLAGIRRVVTIGDEELEVYIYNSNDDMEKDAKNIQWGGFSYKNLDGKYTNLSWDSYPHFYKDGNLIVLYVGKTEKIMNDLNSILGNQFLGIEYRNSLQNVDDVRKTACKYLVDDYKKLKDIKDLWKSCAILDSSETSIAEKNEYAVIFEMELGGRIGVTVDKDTFEYLSSLNID